MIGQGELREGMKVRSRDGEDLGRIIRLDSGFLMVEKGFFFPKDFAIRLESVREVRDDEVWVNASKEELSGDTSFGAYGEHGTTTDTTETRKGFGSDLGRSEGSSLGASGREDTRVSLSEEELTAEKRMREAGEVRVRKEVVTEKRQIDVPVMREEVHVERLPASASATPDKDAFQEKTISVPVHEEEVEIKKRPRVKEEIRVSKSQKQVEHRAEADVKHEEARIERTDDLESRGPYQVGDPDRDRDV